MKNKFKSLPEPLKKEIIIRFGLGAFSLFLTIILLIFGGIILSLPFMLLSLYALINGVFLLHNCLTGNYAVADGTCVRIERTIIRKRVKAIYVQTEMGIIKIPVRKRLRHIEEGSAVLVYMPTKTRVYEQDENFIIFSCYAIAVKSTK